jgi:hypothetical protein
VRDLELRLVRRVVEVRDARLALRAYLPAGTIASIRAACEAVGLTCLDSQATVEAASLAAALCQHAQGEVPRATDALPETPGGANLDEEVAYLMRVAEAYTRSPIVRACRASVYPHPPEPEQAAA